jgi:galactokinase
MNESHTSMRDDFEISTPEVDAVVEASQEAGAFGARMTGGGFGGCIVSLVSEAAFSSWNERLIALAPDCRFIC